MSNVTKDTCVHQWIVAVGKRKLVIPFCRFCLKLSIPNKTPVNKSKFNNFKL